VTIRVVTADDEEPARRGIRRRLARCPDIEIVAECANGREAIAAIGGLAPDLVFLDVQMPGPSGFDIIAAIGAEHFPHVIFVTAYDQHAIKAFEVNALDYLLKPIDDERFDQAVARARRAIADERDGALGRRLAALTRLPTRLVVRSSGRVQYVPVAEIDWIEATGDYATLHTADGTYLLRETLSALEISLVPEGFARIHRSAIVRLDRVAEIKRLDNGDFTLHLRDGTCLRGSRRHADALRRLDGPS